jgi:hypothetical protein
MTTFVHSSKDYDSYRDWWSLIRLSGFGECRLAEVDLSKDEVYVFGYANREIASWLDGIRNEKRKATLAHWNLERPDQDDALLEDRGAGFCCVGFDVRWVSDRTLAKMTPGSVHVVLGSHPGLRDSADSATLFDYDWTHQSYENGRRQSVYGRIRQLGLREAPCAWGRARDLHLKRTLLMVNVLQTPAPIMAPLRFALSAAYRMPIVSEHIADPWPLEVTDFAAMTDLDGIPEAVQRAGKDSWTMPSGLSLHRKLCLEWTFRRGVEDALARLP